MLFTNYSSLNSEHQVMLAEISANTEEAVAKQEVAQTKEEDLAVISIHW